MSMFMAWSFVLAVMLAAALEVAANLLLSRSDGFRRLGLASSALVLVGLAFTCLAYAVRGMDLAVAYALWGGFGILGTSLGGWWLHGQRLKPAAWAGMALLIGGMALLHLA
ncbi:SMR family transporter [Nitratidesulfovibrio vulgaris]|uniref:SMR family transporter n=1 Tax=Nitratidesulfovibrio vulgaris TaxID=881 RepID=UPI0001A80489|nr:SMR family transporter [Nitratidesulfovibrio vulgaris]ADP88213.1 small multidrug resistance protein [Nitratidesulfovibrio vulgaris RCH1]